MFFGYWCNEISSEMSTKDLFQTSELVSIVFFVNILTLLVLLVLHYAFAVANRSAVEKAVDERLQKFIQENADVYYGALRSRF